MDSEGLEQATVNDTNNTGHYAKYDNAALCHPQPEAGHCLIVIPMARFYR